eukprot:13336104-Alexandrium_andersonii.AAC.1
MLSRARARLSFTRVPLAFRLPGGPHGRHRHARLEGLGRRPLQRLRGRGHVAQESQPQLVPLVPRWAEGLRRE